MGYMTEISIRNDGFHEIEEHPDQFIAGIREALHKQSTDRIEFGVGRHGNCCSAYPSHHADVPKVYLSHRGSFLSLDEYSLDARLSQHIGAANDESIERIEARIEDAISMLRSSRRYLRYLRENVPEDERIELLLEAGGSAHTHREAEERHQASLLTSAN